MREGRLRPRGLLVLAAGLGAAGFAPPATAGGDRPNPSIVLIVIDTARADHFESYGYDRPTSPHFREFVEDAVLFERAYSTSAWTVPAHASLFTGLYPATHRATQETQYLHDRWDTLAELLGEAGFETACFSNNPWVSTRGNLVQGFDVVRDLWRRPNWLSRRDEDTSGLPHPTNEAVFEWLDGRDAARPFFLFINYIEPHWRYEAPERYQRAFLPAGTEVTEDSPALFPMPRWYLKPEKIDRKFLPIRTALYDAEIAFADVVLDDLLGGLEERGVLDGCATIVTSDHGENLGDHEQIGHAFTLYDSTIRVPLAIRWPVAEGAGTSRDDPVQLTDLFVTIAGLATVPVGDERVLGHDLRAGPVPPDRAVLAEYYYPKQVLEFFPPIADTEEAIAPFLRRIRSLQVGTDKFIWGSDGRHELFDVSADPNELANRISKDEDRARALEATLTELVARVAEEAPDPESVPELDEEAREKLRSLGYTR
jgi:arylsulfatase A-like enzyme